MGGGSLIRFSHHAITNPFNSTLGMDCSSYSRRSDLLFIPPAAQGKGRFRGCGEREGEGKELGFQTFQTMNCGVESMFSPSNVQGRENSRDPSSTVALH